MNDLKIEGNKIVRPDNTIVFTCEKEIKEIIEEGKKIYVLVFQEDRKEKISGIPNNVLCIDLSGQIIWCIEGSESLGERIAPYLS